MFFQVVGYRISQLPREFQFDSGVAGSSGTHPKLVLLSQLHLDSGPYTLELMAYDGGEPSALTGSAAILVSVEDSNDHEPTFEKDVVTVQVCGWRSLSFFVDLQEKSGARLSPLTFLTPLVVPRTTVRQPTHQPPRQRTDTTLDGYDTAHPTVRSRRLRETFFSMRRAVCSDRTHFLRLSLKATHCLYSNLGQNILVS